MQKLNTGSIDFDRQRRELEADRQRNKYSSPLVNKTYQWIRTYEDELGGTRHEFRCVVCGITPKIPDRNLPSWSGHCYCKPPANYW